MDVIMQEFQQRLQMIHTEESEKKKRVSVEDVDALIIEELHNEFNLIQYDLDETDVLRAIKIESILETYDYVFRKPYALKIFYIIAKATVIQTESVYKLINLTSLMVDLILARMIESNLIIQSANELELTDEGKSLAERLGIDLFIV
jgi:predicted methyltransferase